MTGRCNSIFGQLGFSRALVALLLLGGATDALAGRINSRDLDVGSMAAAMPDVLVKFPGREITLWTSVTCDSLPAAIATAQPGNVLRLEKGENCSAITVRNYQWDVPITLRMQGASIRHLTLWNARGLNVEGGTILPELEGSLAGRGITIRGGSSDITLSGILFKDCRKCLVISEGSRLVTANANIFEPIEDGINFTGPTDGLRFIDNQMRNFRPQPTKCTLPDKEVVLGLSKRDCEAQGGVWKDGAHPDGIQWWGPSIRDVLIARNRIEGNAQGIGNFGSTGGVPPIDVRIVDNTVRTKTGWGINARWHTDLKLTGNDVGRFESSTRKVQIRVDGASGIICDNINPDAPAGDLTVAPCW